MSTYLANLFDLTAWVVIIEFIGALLIVAYVVAAIISLLRHGNVAQARLLVADGAITGLSFKLAGTLLKTIELRTWQQILMFVAIFVPRTVLKRLLAGREAGFKAGCAHPARTSRRNDSQNEVIPCTSTRWGWLSDDGGKR